MSSELELQYRILFDIRNNENAGTNLRRELTRIPKEIELIESEIKEKKEAFEAAKIALENFSRPN